MPAEAVDEGDNRIKRSASNLGLIRRLPVPEVRDYHQINRRVAQWLDAGVAHVRLEGVERQRLLLSGLTGAWSAVIEVCGHAGPELAAGLNAAGVLVIAQDAVDDGAGRNLNAGTLVVRGPCGVALGYRQAGGRILACGRVGPRLGLEQSGGDLIVLGEVGPLAGERQSGGRLVLVGGGTSRRLGHGHRGGELLDGKAAEEFHRTQVRTDSALMDRLAELAPWFTSVPPMDAGT